MSKKKFTAVILDLEYKTFVIYVVFLRFILLTNVGVYLSYKPQITGLITKKTSRIVFAKYNNFVNVFSLDLTSKLSKHIEINDHAIKLEDGQQLLYKPIYSLGPIKLKI